MRCDLHVHSRYSGPVDLPVLRHISRECYSEPKAVYETAKDRGMDLVTITDHDTIEGALELAHLPDFIVGEEVTCELAPGREIHLGVWDLNEGLHEGIARRRRDPESLFAWLAEKDIPACINHPFSPLTGSRDASDFHRAFAGSLAVETLNGMMPGRTNEFARETATRLDLPQVGGSDAHALRQIGRAFTAVPRASTREEFLAGLRAGFSVPVGGPGSYARLTADVFSIFVSALRENLALALAAPLVGTIPLITFASYIREWRGGSSNHELYRSSAVAPGPRRPRARTAIAGFSMAAPQ